MELSEVFGWWGRKTDWLLLFNDKANQQKNYKTLKRIDMFGIFKKKSEVEKLQDKYKKLMKEGYDLQSIDRKASDQKYYEADQVLKKIESLQTS